MNLKTQKGRLKKIINSEDNNEIRKVIEWE
jgi:hypothetical protein